MPFEFVYYVIYALVAWYSWLFWNESVKKYSKSVYGRGFKYALIGHLIYFVLVVGAQFLSQYQWFQYPPQAVRQILGFFVWVPVITGLFVTGFLALLLSSGGHAPYFVLAAIASVCVG